MLDCIEIDGASNNWVENVRDLIEKARFEPNIGKYKIYIIDEVHMLSTGAFNALLKTLEEPPKHVKFILATTEIDKVPETIRSRSLRFDFKKISEADIVKRLEYVCGEEDIKADKEALHIIARAARGGLRDALTLTEQNTVNQEISTEYVRSTLSLIEDSLIDEIISTIIACDRAKMIEILDTLRSRHAEVRGLFDQIMYGLRDAMMTSFEWANSTANFAEYSDIFAVFESAYTRIKIIPDGWLLIEITLMRAVARGEKVTNNSVSLWWTEWTHRGLGEGTVWVGWKKKERWAERASAHFPQSGIGSTLGVFSDPNSFGTFSTKSTKENISERKYIKDIFSEDNNIEEKKKQETRNIDPKTESRQIEKKEKLETTSSSFSYIEFLEAVKKSKPALVTDLKTARFEIQGTVLTLIFAKEWHYGRINTPASKNILVEILKEIYDQDWTLLCKLDATPGVNIANDIF